MAWLANTLVSTAFRATTSATVARPGMCSWSTAMDTGAAVNALGPPTATVTGAAATAAAACRDGPSTVDAAAAGVPAAAAAELCAA
jgi:hypothetical protein